MVLVSKVDADHELPLENIKNPKEVNEMLSDLIEESRHSKNVVGKEFYSKGSGLEHMPGHGHDDFDCPDDDFDSNY